MQWIDPVSRILSELVFLLLVVLVIGYALVAGRRRRAAKAWTRRRGGLAVISGNGKGKS